MNSGPLMEPVDFVGSGPAVNCGGDPPAAVNSGALLKARHADPGPSGTDAASAVPAATGAACITAAFKPAGCAADDSHRMASMQVACHMSCNGLSVVIYLAACPHSPCDSLLSMVRTGLTAAHCSSRRRKDRRQLITAPLGPLKDDDMQACKCKNVRSICDVGSHNMHS